MSFKVNDKLVWNGDKAAALFDKANNRALEMSAILVQNAAVKDAPKDTGLLKSRIERQIENNNAYVGTSLEYAPYLEFGTRFQKAQPFLRPAFLLNIKKIIGIFKKINKAVKYVD
jgi:HK97 gp10 family phage protein